MNMPEHTLNVSEIFCSMQGEGRLSGLPSVFVRLAGCDLRCQWCDTGYALSAKGAMVLTVVEIVEQVRAHDCRHVVVTGGEPMISPHLPELLSALVQLDKHITVETNATTYRPIECDLVSISPKLTNSLSRTEQPAATDQPRRINITAIQSFVDHHDYQLKFVVQDHRDLDEIDCLLTRLGSVDRDKVLLMPLARTKTEHRRRAGPVAEMCIQRGFRYCPRLQVQLWGNRRGR